MSQRVRMRLKKNRNSVNRIKVKRNKKAARKIRIKRR